MTVGEYEHEHWHKHARRPATSALMAATNYRALIPEYFRRTKVRVQRPGELS